MTGKLELSPIEGNLSIRWNEASLNHLVGFCTLESEESPKATAWECRPGFGPAGGTLETTCGPLHLSLEARVMASHVHLRLNARAERHCRVVEIGLMGEPWIGPEPPSWMLYNGYQSWDPAGLVHLHQRRSQSESWWTCGLAGANGSGIGMAALSARRIATRFRCSQAELSLVHSAPQQAEGAGLLWESAPGEHLEGEGIALADGDIRISMAELAGLVRPPSRPNTPVPHGWLSWYHYGTQVSDQNILANSEALVKGGLDSLGYRLVQIDDGWQRAYGDWTPNSNFPSGLAEVAGLLATRNQTTGIWTAPFLVHADSDLARTAPDHWFTPDPKSGQRLVDPRHWVYGPMQVLDGSRPEVRRHLRDTFAELHAAGIRYFKLDFLYAGAYAGLPAFRAAIAAIKRGIRGSYVLACGAPLLPLAGHVDGCRIGQDTATPMFDAEHRTHHPIIIGDEIIAVSRNLAARHFLSSWFQLDPDIALVGGNLQPMQARQLVTCVVLSGGPFFASDELSGLPALRLDLLVNPEIQALVGQGTAVPDWEPNQQDLPASIWRRADGVIGVFNWSEEERLVEVRAPGRWLVRDLWARHQLNSIEDTLKVQLPALGSELYQLSPLGGR